MANPLVAVRAKPETIPVDLIPTGEVLQSTILLDSFVLPMACLDQAQMDTHYSDWCAATEGALIDSIPAHLARKGNATLAAKEQKATRGRGSMPKVRLRRLLPPRLVQDASLPIIIRIDLASKRSLGITLSHSATNKRWRVASIQKGAVMRHNAATTGRDKVLTGDALYSINGRTDDLDLELDKPGPMLFTSSE